MNENRIRVGVIGAGANTIGLHIPGLLGQPEVEVVAVANRTRKSSMRVARKFNIEHTPRSWEEIVYDDCIDAVCIGTWPYMHAPLTISALENGKHVLCEARMAMNSLEAAAMLEASRMHPNQVAQIVPSPMTFKIDNVVSDFISTGFIGDLISIDARVTGSHFPQWNSVPTWRHERDYSGNNIMFMGIWYESILKWFGPACSVQALGQTIVKYRSDGNARRIAMTIPDHVSVLSEMEQGGQMSLLISQAVGLMPAIDIYICGTDGTLHISEEKGELQLAAGTRAKRRLSRVHIPKKKQGGWRVEEEFINAIRGAESIIHTDFVTGLKYMEWTDAVTVSLRTGRKVILPLDSEL